MNIREKLLAIQQELKAPKNQYNTFGKYKYRNCEDILEAAKPLSLKHRALLTLTDEVVAMENDYTYLKAIVTLKDCESDEIETVSAWAREAKTQKGMNDAQITGATSSYARKCALGGLFCIDDTKDADAQDNRVDPIDVNKAPRNGRSVIKSIVSETAKITRKDIEFRTWMSDHKSILNKLIGDDTLYYTTLNAFEYKKSTDVPVDKRKAVAQAILKEITIAKALVKDGE